MNGSIVTTSLSGVRLSGALLAGALLLSGTVPCAAQPYPGAYSAPGQPPPTSHYADGTGNVAVDPLNASQLNQNYRGPWYQVPASRVRPGYIAPAYPPPGPTQTYPQPPAPMPNGY